MWGPVRRASRKLLFAGVTLLLTGLGLEGGLRLVGYQGQPDRSVSWSPEHRAPEGSLLVRRELDGVPYYASMTEAQPHPWPVEKPGRRYFAIGGSAVHGYGFSRTGAWPDKLERMLQAAWDEPVEVINLGTIAWSSQQNLRLVKEILAEQQADGLLLYMGNNEFLEWLGARQVLPEPELRRWVSRTTWSRRLRRLRSYRLGVSLLEEPGQWGQSDYSGTTVPLQERARRTAMDDDFAREGFRLNLARVLELAQGVPVHLSTVAVNLDYRPADMDRPMGPADPLLQEADRLLAEGRLDEATQKAEAAMEAGPPDQVAFIWGQTLERMGHWEEALEWQELALALDQAPNRAPHWVNEVVQDSAAIVVLGAEALTLTAPHGLVGFETIYDHCHPTPDSHTVLAQAFARSLGVEPEPLPEFAPEHVHGWLGPGEHYSLDPGTERAQWWRELRDPQTAEQWNERGLVAWHTFTGDCESRGTPCLEDAAEAFERAGNDGLCVAWENLAIVYESIGHPGAEEAREALSACPAQ